MGSYFSQLVHEAILSEGDASLKLYGVKLSKKDASIYAQKLSEQLGTKLHYLSIDSAKLKYLPSEICSGLTLIHHLQLTGNQLCELPQSLSKLQTLKTLILGDNLFSKLPSSILQLSNLTRLDLSRNILKGMPDGLADSLPNLMSLQLQQNKLEDSFTWTALCRITKLTQLDISHNSLKQIPPNFSQLSNLKELKISSNQITSIEPVFNLNRLEVFELSRLQIDPSSFNTISSSNTGGIALKVLMNLTRLVILDLSHNKIASIPSELLSTLTRLRILKLNDNKITKIPKEISDLKQLQELYLHENALNKLGKSIAHCSNLQKLHCEYNNLTKLPSVMKTMAKLNTLMLHNNKFKIIPEPLYDGSFVAHLYTLSLEGNPLTDNILRSIAEKGTREYVLERELKLREEESTGTGKGRPSLHRIASQYGSLRAGTTTGMPSIPPPGLKSKRSVIGLMNGNQSPQGNSGYGTLRGNSSRTPSGFPSFDRGLTLPPTSESPSTNESNSTADGSKQNNKSTETSSNATQNATQNAPNPALTPSKRAHLNRAGSSSMLPTTREKGLSKSKTLSSTTSPTAIGPDGPITAPISSLSANKAFLHRDRAMSSPSRISSTANSLAQIVKFDPTLEIPPFNRFKEHFEVLLKQLDFNETRCEELRKASVDTKWELMKIYKGTLVQLLSNDTARVEREKKFEAWQKVDKKIERLASPQYFISSLKGQNISMSDMNTLKSMFESAPLSWIYEFIDCAGIGELARFLMWTVMKQNEKDKTPQDLVKETEAINCMSVLASASPNVVLSTPDAVSSVVLCLASDQLAIIKPALQLLVQIINDHPYASKVIIEALENTKKVMNLPHRFTILMQLLSDLPHLKQDYDVKADILALISKIGESQGLIERFLFRKELFKLGFQQCLEELNEAPHHGVQIQLEALDESIFADSESIKTLAATDYRVLLKIQDNDDDKNSNIESDAESRGNLTNRSNSAMYENRNLKRRDSLLPSALPGNLSLPAAQNSLKILVGDFGSTALRFTPLTTVQDIISKLLQRFSISHPEFYTLFFLSTASDKMEGIWVDDMNSTIADLVSTFGAGGCIASYKMRPWKLTVDCPFAKTSIETELEPTWSVQQAMAHIVTSNSFSLDDDYELSVLLELPKAEKEATDIVPISGRVTVTTTDRSRDSTPRGNDDNSGQSHDPSSGASRNEDNRYTPISSATPPPMQTIDESDETSDGEENQKSPSTQKNENDDVSGESARSEIPDIVVCPDSSPETRHEENKPSETTESKSDDKQSEKVKQNENEDDKNKQEEVQIDNNKQQVDTQVDNNKQDDTQIDNNKHEQSKQDLLDSSAQLDSNQNDSNGSKVVITSESLSSEAEDGDAPDSVPKEHHPIKPISSISPTKNIPTLGLPTRSEIEGAAPPSPRFLRSVSLIDHDVLHSLEYSQFTIADLLAGRVRLQLALKPKKIRVFMGEEGLPMEVDMRWTIAELLDHIAMKVPEVQPIVSDYGIILETKSRGKRRSVAKQRGSSRRQLSDQLGSKSETNKLDNAEWLNNSKTLAFYDFDARKHILRLALRPRELFVELPNGKEISLMIGFEESVSLVIKIAVSHLGEDSGLNYSLFSGSNLLSRQKTLRDAGVKPGDRLVLRQEIETSTSAAEVDVNIWQEPQTEEYTKYEAIATSSVPGAIAPTMANLRKSQLLAATTFNKIIEMLTDPDDYDPEFHDTFLFTYRSFATSEQLLQKIIQRYNVPASIEPKIRDTIRVRVCVFLTQWLDKQYQELDDQLIEKMNIWIENEVEDERRALLLKALNRVRIRKGAQTETVAPTPINLPNVGSKISLLDLEVAEIAKQLTLYTWSVFSQIKPIELFDCAWSKPKLQHLAPNVLEMISRFNYISNWVATEICMEPKLRVRRTKFTKIVKVASILRDLNNYHMLYAFITGWNNSSVSRLKWTSEKLSKQTRQTIAELEALMSMEGSFKVYRDAIKKSGNTSTIPYIGIPLKDLTFIEDGNPNLIDGLINWSKRRLVYVVVGDFLRSALVPLRIVPVVVNSIPINDIIKQLPQLDENGMYDASLKAEPRGAKPEQLQ